MSVSYAESINPANSCLSLSPLGFNCHDLESQPHSPLLTFPSQFVVINPSQSYPSCSPFRFQSPPAPWTGGSTFHNISITYPSQSVCNSLVVPLPVVINLSHSFFSLPPLGSNCHQYLRPEVDFSIYFYNLPFLARLQLQAVTLPVVINSFQSFFSLPPLGSNCHQYLGPGSTSQFTFITYPS